MPKDDPLILFYTRYFGRPVDLAGFERRVPGRWTLDRSRIAEADAIVFHIPNAREVGDARKYPGQAWVAWSLESKPNYPRLAAPDFMRHFEIVMTYEQDSDVWSHYLPRRADWDAALQEPLPAKTEAAPAVMFVSSDIDLSGRASFAAELSRHIEVDSYGRFMRNRVLEGRDLGARTKRDVIARYRFCLALENSIAPDYVTEKLFDPLLSGSVPVYLGAENVAEFAPAHSYIDVRDFAGPKALADYLRHLTETPEAYDAYFAWRSRPLPAALQDKIRMGEVSAFDRLMSMVAARRASHGGVRPGRARLPFGIVEFLQTRRRRWSSEGRFT